MSQRLAILFLALCLPLGARAAEKPPAISLDEALKRLDAESLTLAQARGRAQEARAIVRQVMAGFLPIASAGGSYTRNSASAKFAASSILDSIEGGLNHISPVPVHLDRSNVPADTVIQPLEAFNGQAALRVPLFAGNAYWDWSSAKESAKAAEESVESVRLQLRGALVQSAWWAGSTEEVADATQRALTVATEHEQSAARAVQAGTSAPLAHLQAETEVVRRENDLARANAERERAWLALGVLLGKAEPIRIELPPMPQATPTDPGALINEAVGRRPEIRAQKASIHAAELQLDSAWWRLAPQLSTTFSAFASNVDYPTGDNTGWKLTVDLSWTLYDGGLRYGKHAQAEAQVETGNAALEAQKVEIAQQVKDATRDVDVARERLRLATRQMQLAQEVYASAKRSFDAGLASSLDVLDANDRLYQADVGMADAKARLGMAHAALARATGSLL